MDATVSLPTPMVASLSLFHVEGEKELLTPISISQRWVLIFLLKLRWDFFFSEKLLLNLSLSHSNRRCCLWGTLINQWQLKPCEWVRWQASDLQIKIWQIPRHLCWVSPSTKLNLLHLWCVYPGYLVHSHTWQQRGKVWLGRVVN